VRAGAFVALMNHEFRLGTPRFAAEGQILAARHAQHPFTKRQRRAHRTGKCRANRAAARDSDLSERCRWIGSVVVFIDGDFWHGNPKTRHNSKTNAEHWTKKIRSNRRRDKLLSRRLESQGWRVVRIWESDLRRDAEAVMAKVRLLD